jgi:hypothetical protein
MEVQVQVIGYLLHGEFTRIHTICNSYCSTVVGAIVKCKTLSILVVAFLE